MDKRLVAAVIYLLVLPLRILVGVPRVLIVLFFSPLVQHS